MSISASIIKDSINSNTDDRLTTFVVTFPRFINAEVLRHRMLSFNSASSRAIPSKKLIADVMENPAVPVFWGKNQAGMQAYEELDDVDMKHYVWVTDPQARFSDKLISDREQAKRWWLDARDRALDYVKVLSELGLHKQIVNRITEPWQNITLIISGTEWQNFFKLRASAYAQPEFKELAYIMLELYNNNIPIVRTPDVSSRWFSEKIHNGDWHLPYESNMPPGILPLEKIQISVARCARVSYLTQDGTIDKEKDFELYDRLTTSGHFSPCEHVALPVVNSEFYGNFKGWKQYRKFLPVENANDERVIVRKVVDGKVI